MYVIQNATPSGIICNCCSGKSFTRNNFLRVAAVVSGIVEEYQFVPSVQINSLNSLIANFPQQEKLQYYNRGFYRKVLHMQCLN